jgi:hypothetical protein
MSRINSRLNGQADRLKLWSSDGGTGISPAALKMALAGVLGL